MLCLAQPRVGQHPVNIDMVTSVARDCVLACVECHLLAEIHNNVSAQFPTLLEARIFNEGKLKENIFKSKGNSNFELGTAICYVNVENYFLTIIKHIAVPSSKLEFPFEQSTNRKMKPKDLYTGAE